MGRYAEPNQNRKRKKNKSFSNFHMIFIFEKEKKSCQICNQQEKELIKSRNCKIIVSFRSKFSAILFQDFNWKLNSRCVCRTGTFTDFSELSKVTPISNKAST